MTITPAASPLRVESFTIASGESLSAAIDLTGCVPVAIIMPASWTTADLTFQASDLASSATYSNVYDEFGSEVVVSAAASRHIVLDPSTWVSCRNIKIRSGTSGTAVNQGADRTIKLVCRPI